MYLKCIFLATVFGLGSSIRLCNNWWDYNNIFSSNCYNSDIDNKNVSQIINDWGFEAQEYHLQTEDGYNLLINRGFKGKINDSRPVVILSHGTYLNALAFVVQNNDSVGFNFMEAGYDVWIPNYRGTKFSRTHANLSTWQREYWDFSFHEIAIYDVRQTIELIYKTTNRKAVYIGYSMGSTMGVVYSSLYPTEAENYLLGTYYYSTAVYWNHAKTYTYNVLRLIYPLLNPVFGSLLHGEFVPHIDDVLRFFCTGTTVNVYICEIAKGLTTGFNYDDLDPVGTVLLNGVILDTTSWNCLVHFFQIMNEKDFKMFNYGKTKNIQSYGQKDPPTYNFSTISIPMGIIQAKNDYLAATEDVERFYNEISVDLKSGYYLIENPSFAHLDYMQTQNLKEQFIIPLLNGVAELIVKTKNNQ